MRAWARQRRPWLSGYNQQPCDQIRHLRRRNRRQRLDRTLHQRRRATVPSVDLSGSIDLNSGHPIYATISYDGSNLIEALADSITGQVFTQTYTGVNIPSLVGGNTAYVGFTASDSTLTATQVIKSWTYTPGSATSGAPSAPQNVAAVLQGYNATSTASVPMTAMITWNPVAGATGYNIYRASSSDEDFYLYATLGASNDEYSNVNLSQGEIYFYEVTATSPGGESEDSGEVWVSTPVATIAPTNAAAASITSNSISLTWTDNANNEDGFQIYRSVSGGAFSLLVALPADVSVAPSTDTYTDTNLLPSTTYDYRILAYNASGPSAFTEVDTATLPAGPTAAPTAPTNLAASAFSTSQINLSWTDNDVAPNVADGYAVEESTDGVHFTQIAVAPAGAVGYSVAGLAAGTSYEFRVRAHDSIGYSGYSNVAQASTNSNGGVNFNSFATGSAGSLTFNGGASVSGSNLVLTNGQILESRSVFTTAPIGISTFTTTFTFLVTGSGNQGDGLTFTIQGSGNTALGANGGGLGYQGIAKSVAIKFDLYNNAGEGSDSTGVFINGAAPTTPAIDMTGSVNLHSGDPISATISYDGANLVETLVDLVTKSTFNHTYTGINIPSIVGGTSAYVGFTASTGGFKSTQVVQNWTLSNLPNAPSNLTATAVSPTEIDLAWTSNDVKPNLATGYLVEDSTDGIHFATIGFAPAGSSTFQALDFRRESRMTSSSWRKTRRASRTPRTWQTPRRLPSSISPTGSPRALWEFSH